MQDLPFWKAILIALGIVGVAVAYIFLTSLIGLGNPWIAFVALTVWGAMGMKMEQAPGVFLGGAIGLLISFALAGLPELYGEAAALLPAAAIVLAIACKIKDALPVICNFGLFIFLTIGTADIILGQKMHLQYLQDLAFGALCLWIAPWAVMKLRSGGIAGD